MVLGLIFCGVGTHFVWFWELFLMVWGEIFVDPCRSVCLIVWEIYLSDF